MAIFFDLDDTLLDDRGAQRTYLKQVYDAWRDDLPHSEDAFPDTWRAALQHHFDRHVRGEISCVHVGDDWERDVQGARAGGFCPVWLDRRHHPEPMVSSDAEVSRITTLVELVRLVERE